MALSGEFASEGAMDLSKDTVGENVQHGSVPSGTDLNNEPLWKTEILCTQLTLLFRLKLSHLQASTIPCQMLLPTLGSHSVYIYYLMLF